MMPKASWLISSKVGVSIQFCAPSVPSPVLPITITGDSGDWSLTHLSLQRCCCYSSAYRPWDFPPYPHNSGECCRSGLAQVGWAASGVGWLRDSGALQSWGVSGTRSCIWCCAGKECLSWLHVPGTLSRELGKVQTGKNVFSLWWVVLRPGRETGTHEAMGLAKPAQWSAAGQGGSEDPDFPLIPHCDLSGQAEWPATCLGHGLGPGVGEWAQEQDSAVIGMGQAGSAQNTNAVKQLKFHVLPYSPWGWGLREDLGRCECKYPKPHPCLASLWD